MKKYLLLLCLTAALLAGCGSPPETPQATQPPVTEAPVIEAPVIEAPVIEAPVIEAPVTEAPAAPAAEPTFRAEFAPFTVPEQVVLDRYGIRVTTGESGMDEEWGYYVDLIYQNSSDQDATFNWGYCTVNGCISGWTTMMLSVPAGETVTSRLYPLNWHQDSDMVLSTGIRHLGEIQVLAGLYLNNTDPADIEPLTIRTSDYAVMERPAFPAGTVCYDDGSLRITATRQNIRAVYGDDFHVLIENNTDKSFYLDPRILSVNGIAADGEVDAIFPDVDRMILPGTVRMFQTDLASKNPERYGLDDIKEIEVSFLLRDYPGWETIYAESEPVILK